MMRKKLRELLQYPSAVAGLFIIALLVAVSIYTVIAIPYSEGIRLWRGGEDIWIESPRNARPRWVGIFSGERLPETLIASGSAAGQREVEISLPIEWSYDGFPSEINLFLDAKFSERRPHLTLTWLMPDGRNIALGERSVGGADRYSISLDRALSQKLGRKPPEVALFPAKGHYELRIKGLLFEEDSALDAKLVVYGQVHGMAGTDHLRRDLMVALLWGTPMALSFGFLAAVGSSIATLVIAAAGVWFGRWVDAAIQRITEINSILPMLPILIMVGMFYSRSLWVMLGVVVLLSIFSLGIKTYRAIFLQVKESPYIEAARAYGAGNTRIILHYMIPRVIPILIPHFVILVPSFVFLEAALALLGLGDPVLPTWGKVVNDAYANGALYKGYYYWVLAPSLLLMLTGIGFSLVGFALDRIFNPRLRSL